MSDLYQARLQRLTKPENYRFLANIQRGIEKEGLRVTPHATIAQTGHQQALGSALTHGSITTDYSEALLEFITPVFSSVEDSIDYLGDLHSYTLRNIDEEYIWPASMPCRLEGDASIPIARYGSSNIGQMKHVYRQGLAHRYGRIMQSIAGIHYNFSMPEDFWPHCQKLWGSSVDVQTFKSERYFALIRNFRRHSWLLSYLFGASPVLDSSFVDSKPHKLSKLSKDTLGLPFATSLRMSDLGYQSKAQASLNICHNHLDNYIHDLTRAIQEPYPVYEAIGVKVNGEHRQLNTNILQIENEYYSDIRPKRVMLPGEKPIEALRNRGVEYVEVRILDTNPYLSVGIDAEQVRFLDAFLLYCLLSESPEITAFERAENKINQQRVSLEGRKPTLMLSKKGKPVAFSLAAKQLLDEIVPIAKLLDKAHETPSDIHFYSENQAYCEALSAQVEKVDNSELTPSGRIMKVIAKGGSFSEHMLIQAKQHKGYFSKRGLPAAINEEFNRLGQASLRQQMQLESNDANLFDDFLIRYNAS